MGFEGEGGAHASVGALGDFLLITLQNMLFVHFLFSSEAKKARVSCERGEKFGGRRFGKGGRMGGDECKVANTEMSKGWKNNPVRVKPHTIKR